MRRFGVTVRSAGILAAATLGAGIFSLPYVTAQAGWMPAICLLTVLSVVIIFVHRLYWRALDAERDREPLLDRMRTRFGAGAYAFGLAVIGGGLLLTLVAYLILGGYFLRLVVPSLDPTIALLLVWVLSTATLGERLRVFATAETLAAALKAALILLVLVSIGHADFSGVPVARSAGALAATGAILFALAGWTGIEPMFGYERRSGRSAGSPSGAVVWGTVAVGVLYALFAIAVLGSGAVPSPDTLTGLIHVWPWWKVTALAVLGLLTIWTAYASVGRELLASLAANARIGKTTAALIVGGVPLLLVASGSMRSFVGTIELVGGVFLALQYVCLVAVSIATVRLRSLAACAAYSVLAVFLCIALYEIYVFVLH